MSRRAATVAQTRRRIVDAARALHGERGIAATSWDDIAARAGVGVGTVYRHFPSLDELIPACGEVTMQVVALPDPSTAQALFADAKDPADRIERLVREVFAIYDRAHRELHAIRQEAEVHPRVAQDRKELEASLTNLINEGLKPLKVTHRDRAVTRALLDLNTWQALQNNGLKGEDAVKELTTMLASRLSKGRRSRPDLASS